MDVDILVLVNIDDFFDREELLVVLDLGWFDCFNFGVFVY